MDGITAARWGMAALIALQIARSGFRKGSLSGTGAVAAFAVGFLSLGSSFTFGAALLLFYFTGSKFTRLKADFKKTVDLDVKSSGGGERGAAQVLCTAGVGAALCLALLLIQPGGAGVGGLRLDLATHPTATIITLAYLGNFACVCGDTWASELGILSRGDPILITRCARVPRGTNGGVSGWGTLMSAAGGAFIGLVMCLDALLAAIIVAVSGGTASDVSERAWELVFLPLLGLAAGLVGSLLDSVLGATLQGSWMQVQPPTGRTTAVLPPGALVLDQSFEYKPKVEAVGKDSDSSSTSGSDSGSGSSSGGARRRGPAAAVPATTNKDASTASDKLAFVRISGWPLLSNEAVNLLSSAATAALTAVVGAWLLAAWRHGQHNPSGTVTAALNAAATELQVSLQQVLSSALHALR